ncbi:hydrolase [Spirochaetia bacterium]|nr:hydrolase [Spirochaetia bacterium]
MINEKQWFRKASGGEGEIFCRLWTDDKPKAVLQIAHGMAEHSERYLEFANFLAKNGFAVCMEDHAGHGPQAKQLGFFAEKDGWASVLNDMHALSDEVSAMFPGEPVFLMGHSMGSFLSRSYITRWGNTLSGCILSGTMGPNPILGIAKALAGITAVFKGKRATARLLTKITGSANSGKFRDEPHEFAWLSTDTAEVQKYEDDPLCGFPFTAGAYLDMFTGVLEISAPVWAGNVPKTLPLYIYSGDNDPVGDYGAGVKKVYESLKAGGIEDLELKLYPGGRHEMHNEVNKKEVYADVLNWLNGHIE